MSQRWNSILASFSNKISQSLNKPIPSLDGLRAISILLVISVHAANGMPLSDAARHFLSTYSRLGVTIFFVISGFLITTLLLKEKDNRNGVIDIKKFYVRRFLRIFPVFYLYIFVVFILSRIYHMHIPSSAFWHAITYTTNYALGGWFLGHAWSLAVEEQFYLFWPWVIRLSDRKIFFMALAIIFYAPVVRAIKYFWNWPDIYTLAPFFQFADSLMIGSVLGIILHRCPDLSLHNLFKNRWLRWGCVLAVIVIAVLESDLSKWSRIVLLFGRPIISACVSFLIVSVIAVKDDRCFRFLNHPIMVYIGVLSYSIYIWQELFLFSQDGRFSFFPFPMVVNVFLTFVAAVISYHLWERYFLECKKRFVN